MIRIRGGLFDQAGRAGGRVIGSLSVASSTGCPLIWVFRKLGVLFLWRPGFPRKRFTLFMAATCSSNLS